MIRQNLGKGFIIYKKDLISQIVQKKPYKTNIEFWIYKHRSIETSLVLSPTAKKTLEEQSPIYLQSIIVSRDTSEFIKETKDYFLVQGIKFDEKDLDDYLSKTERK
jgi:hypothetical protein